MNSISNHAQLTCGSSSSGYEILYNYINVVQINAVGVKRRRTTTVLRLLLRVSVIGCGKEGLYIRAHFGYNGQYGAIW